MSGKADSPPRVFPVVDALVCDAETPVGVYARLRQLDPRAFMLESVVGQERWARYSFLGVGYRARLVGRWSEDSGAIEVSLEAGEGFELPPALVERVQSRRGLEAVEALMAHYRAEPAAGLPRFWGGLVGVFGHELVRGLERLPRPAHHARRGEGPGLSTGLDAGALPCFELWLTDTLVIFDNLSQRLSLVSAMVPEDEGGEAAAREAAKQRLARVRDCLRRPPAQSLAAIDLSELGEVAATVDPHALASAYPTQVERAREYIHAGDVFQLVLSQPFVESREELDPLSIYRSLRFTNPAPYMYLLELGAATLVGASPEVLVRVDRDDRRVTVRPLAGTRRRGADEAEDAALEAELLADPKERAEHLMLIDLGRNDVGRVAVAGSVEVPDRFVIERYSRVMHIVSEVRGTLRPELGPLDALRATFPAGTLSGAPKVRALELIDELEAVPRGWYGGAVGYLGFDGGADFAICIRSVVVGEDQLRIQAGAGIVFDSQPQAEDEECHKKASAVLRAIELARGIERAQGEAKA